MGRGLALAGGRAPRLLAAVFLVQLVEALAMVGTIQGLQLCTAALLYGDADAVQPADLAWPGTLLIASMTMVAICQSVQPALATVLGERLATVTTAEVLQIAGSVPLADFDRPEVLDRLKRVETGSLVRPAQLAVGIGILLSGAVGAAALTVAVLTVQPWLAAVAVVAAFPLWWAARRDGAQTYETVRGLSRLERRRIYLAGLLTRRDRAAEVRALALTPILLERYSELSEQRFREIADTAWNKARRQLTARAAGGLLLAVGFGALVVVMITGQLAVPEAVAAAAAGAALRGRLADAATGIRQVQEAAQFVDDHAAVVAAAPPIPQACPVIDMDPAAASSQAAEQAPAADRIRSATTTLARHGTGTLEVSLAGVELRYPGAAEPALRGVDLTVRTGQVIALVGANGSGKSTLAAIMAGLLTPTRGRVLWNGADRALLSTRWWRPDVSLLLQNPGRYDETLRDNVAFGAVHRPVDDAAIASALSAAGADAVLARASDGLDTDLGREQDGGAELSGGQWQRIALARTLYRGGQLLILDEPSAPLDPMAERDLVHRIRRSFAEKAVLLITHRMPAAMAADQVVVLDRGVVIEQGRPGELISARGAFHQMCRAADELWELQPS